MAYPEDIHIKIGGSGSDPDCDCVSTIYPCIFGSGCSQLNAVITSVCVCFDGKGTPVISSSLDTNLVLPWNSALATSTHAAWSYISGGHTSTIEYDLTCQWNATLSGSHVPGSPLICGTDCTSYTFTSYCMNVMGCSPCLQTIIVPKNVREYIGSADICANYFNIPSTGNLGWKVADISLSTPCTNTDLSCTGWRAYMAVQGIPT